MFNARMAVDGSWVKCALLLLSVCQAELIIVHGGGYGRNTAMVCSLLVAACCLHSSC